MRTEFILAVSFLSAGMNHPGQLRPWHIMRRTDLSTI